MCDGSPSAAPAQVYDLVLNDGIVSTHDTREEAQAAMLWYVKTYGPPSGTFYVEERVDA